MTDLSQFTLPNDTGIVLLDCTQAFQGLTNKEKQYAHYLSEASWYGGLIVLFQTSPESPGIFLLLQKLFRQQNSIEQLKQVAQQQGLSDEEFQAFLMYAAGFYSNTGNYKSFGDTKFIPNLPKEKLESLLFNSAAAQADAEGIKALWKQIGDAVYSLTEREQQLGLGNKGISTYYSYNCDMSDAEVVHEFLIEKKLSAYNTRVFKHIDSTSGNVQYEIRLASSKSGQERIPGEENGILGTHTFTPKKASQSVTVKVVQGDYNKLMELVVENLKLAKEHAANDTEKQMLEHYMSSFSTGSIPEHKEGSRYWIRDKGPIVEMYIGFIESYRDPFGVRGEFEGFVSMVNKEMSAKFRSLVDQAEHFLPLLPWPAAFEKDKFLRPDFTSLDVLTFATSGIPAGINIPNYDDIRQVEGFKNVSLGNVLSAGYKDTKITFLNEADKELFAKYKAPSFEVQVGLHELLGHGSGKLFIKDSEGKFNFDIENVKHPETGEVISSWFDHNETYDSIFKSMGSPYEECRAECVGLYLCLSGDVLRIFGHEGNQADDIIYINWLNMVRAGLLALEFYTPQTESWRQAHMQARYVILRVLLEAGEDLVTIKKTTGDDGEPDLVITIDRSKITPIGKPAIGNFLQKLTVYKATADYDRAKAMFDHYSAVFDHDEPHFLTLRNTVIKRKQPRKMFVQSSTTLNETEGVVLKEYTADPLGMIESMQDRFSGSTDVIIRELWEKDRQFFLPA